MKRLVPKFKDGSKYEPKKNKEGKYIINTSDPRDVKFMHELQGKRGAKARSSKDLVKKAYDVATLVTPLGDVEDVVSIYRDTKEGNYGDALLTAGLLFPSLFIPGNLNKARKAVSKSSSELPFDPPSDVPDYDIFNKPAEPSYEGFTKWKDHAMYMLNRLKKSQESPKKVEYTFKATPPNRSLTGVGDDMYEYIDYGEYYHPEWEEFYRNVIAPNYKGDKVPNLPEKLPRMVQFSDKDAGTVGGLFTYGEDQARISINRGNKSTGVHEYVSHGTDWAMRNSGGVKDWMGAYTFVPKNKFKVADSYKVEEKRSTLNEAKYDLYQELKKSNEASPNIEQFRKGVDALDDNTLRTRVVKNSKGDYYNSYAQDYDDELSSLTSQELKKRLDHLRYLMKFGYGLTGVSLVGNHLLPKEQE